MGHHGAGSAQSRGRGPTVGFGGPFGQAGDGHSNRQYCTGPWVGIDGIELADAMDASMEGTHIIQHPGECGEKPTRSAFFKETEQGQAIFPRRARVATTEDKIVADLLTDHQQSAEGDPDQGVEPVEDLENSENPIQDQVGAFDVGQFMEEEEPLFVVGKAGEEVLGQEQSGMAAAGDGGGGQERGFRKLHLGTDADDAATLQEEIEDGGITDGRGGIQRQGQASMVPGEQEGKDDGAREPKGEGSEEPSGGVDQGVRGCVRRVEEGAGKAEDLEGELGDGLGRQIDQVEEAEGAFRGDGQAETGHHHQPQAIPPAGRQMPSKGPLGQQDHHGQKSGLHRVAQEPPEQPTGDVGQPFHALGFGVQHLPEAAELVVRQASVLDEMGEHGSEGAIEHAVEERLGVMGHSLGFADGGPIDIGAAFLVKGEGAFFHQTSDQGPGGFGMPRFAGIEGVEDFIGGAVVLGPHDLHDLPFRFGDAWNFLHGCSYLGWAWWGRSEGYAGWLSDASRDCMQDDFLYQPASGIRIRGRLRRMVRGSTR